MRFFRVIGEYEKGFWVSMDMAESKRITKQCLMEVPFWKNSHEEKPLTKAMRFTLAGIY